jgi:hypothetical protein
MSNITCIFQSTFFYILLLCSVFFQGEGQVDRLDQILKDVDAFFAELRGEAVEKAAKDAKRISWPSYGTC